ncbi:hypothetical protein QTP86_014851 [Hemibagrus guttatus]|nr:hypothetical protein QTP86_014851 [Hemibagrus guttatus]
MNSCIFFQFLQIDRIIFCVFLENDYGIYNRKMSDYFPPDTTKKTDTDDVHMDSQVDQDVDMLSQGGKSMLDYSHVSESQFFGADLDMDHPDTPSQQAETCTSVAENPAKEMTSEKCDPVEDEKSAGESKPKQQKEKHEEKKGDSEQGAGGAGVEKEKGAGEKTENAPADTKQEDEEDQATSMNSKDTDSQGLEETMEVEGAENVEKNTTTDISKSEGEVKQQDKSLAGTNQVTQTDSSQSKDGSGDKGEPSKE